MAVGPEVGVGAEGEDFGWVDGTFGVIGAGWSGLKWMGTSTATTSVGASGAVKNEFPGEDWTGNGESFIARKSVRVVIIGTGVDLVITIVFIENEPGIDVGDVAGDIDFLGKDENLREVVYGIVDFVGDIDITINSKSTIDVHGESVHKLLTGGVASRDEVAAAIELIEIGGTIHGAEAGVSLVIELREAEIILRGSFIRSETSDGIARISNDGVAKASFEAGEDGGADAGDAGIARSVFIVGDSHVANVANT